LQVTFVGMASREIEFSAKAGQTVNLGNIILAQDENVLDEVVVTGTIDIAKDRQTPVAVSTIRAIDIQENLGTQELPEILNSTPSVYATKQGGGFGDSRVNIRGFDQANTAVMINGQPVNDMENGWVYWSNWAGLSDVTTAMQVQRGLGSSKLAISSVGGTINVVTQTSSAREGGTLATVFGNDGYMKFLGSYNTGLLENGLSASVLISNTSGDGYVDGTKFKGSNYFIGLGYKINEKHDLQFIFTGAPQWHHQKSWAPTISDHQKYQPGGADENATKPNRKYNSDWGYLNGNEYSFRRNFYHKPVMSLNWEWEISEDSRLSTVLYGSWGRGGGTGEIGRINGNRQYSSVFKDNKGLVRVDDIYAWNSGQSVPDFANPDYGQPTSRTPYNGAFSNTGNNGHPDGEGKYGSDNGISRRASMNSHNWYGSIINYHNDINEEWSFDVGADLRMYEGIHYRTVNDVLGADNYIDYDNMNNRPNLINPNDFVDAKASWNPWDDIDGQEKIDYYNDGLVNWAGLFGQVEYTNEIVSAFIQGSFSNQGFERVEYFNETPDNQKSGVENMSGGNIKGGINYNINENHNVFFNSGYYSKQPKFDAVYLNFGNNLNPDLTNEKIIGLELGYGFRSINFRANANLYRTSWEDRFETASVTLNEGQADEFRGSANYKGVKQVHTGLELDFSYRILSNLRVNGFASFGNWEYEGNADADIFDDNQEYQGSSTLYLDGVKVGDAAQVTAGLGANYTFLDGFSAGLNWRLASSLYADIAVADFQTDDHKGSLELPSYNLFDARLAYKWEMKDKNSLEFSTNINNLFDELYISESDTNYHAEAGDNTWEGINTGNRVYFGWGRTWNFSVRYRF
ncbi:MAG: TonB-dependent receptor plug domain-containing protein, partial [Flavobacteriaceae bacterium]|nr:TonB-dependent receptor plug domain-containing protein [Flavobacteriaceae bacterium]